MTLHVEPPSNAKTLIRIGGEKWTVSQLPVQLNGALRIDAPCSGDFEPDGDVDGKDLATLVARGISVESSVFAANFGRDSDCTF